MLTLPSGIPGLDEILHGGPGCGKRVLAMELRVNGHGGLLETARIKK